MDDEPAARDESYDDVLAAAPHRLDPLPGKRRAELLARRRDRDAGQEHLDGGDRFAADGGIEAAGDGLDFGELGHLFSEHLRRPRGCAITKR
jgi:hypothetical protein